MGIGQGIGLYSKFKHFKCIFIVLIKISKEHTILVSDIARCFSRINSNKRFSFKFNKKLREWDEYSVNSTSKNSIHLISKINEQLVVLLKFNIETGKFQKK